MKFSKILAGFIVAGSLGLPAIASAQPHFTELHVVWNNARWLVDESTGARTRIGGVNDWVGTTSFANAGLEGWIIEDDALWKVSLHAPGFTHLQDGWGGPTQLAFGIARHTVAGGYHRHLYAQQDNSLWRVEEGSGAVFEINNEDWAGTTSMINYDFDGTEENLFAIDDDALWRVNVITGGYTRLSDVGDWFGPTSMTEFATELYIVQAGELWRARPTDGAITHIAAGFPATTSMTALGGSLYVIDSGKLYEVNPNTGSKQRRGAAVTWPGQTYMVAVDAGLF